MGMTGLVWEERAEQGVEAARAQVRHAEVGDRQFLSATHRPEADGTAASARLFQLQAAVCRRKLLRDVQYRTGQTDPLCQRAIR